MRQRPGNSIIEVLLAVSIASIIIASVGNLIVSINRVDRTSTHRDQAVAYAREALEIANTQAGTTAWFVCNTAGCGCTKLPGYDSCWESCPAGLTCDGEYGLDTTTNLLTNDPAIIPGTSFTRTVNVTDQAGDSNVKDLAVVVSWSERSQPKQVVQQTILTGWKPVALGP